jgi:hypothetical protein
MDTIQSYIRTIFGSDYELSEKSENIKEIKVISFFSFRELVAFLMYGIIMFFVFRHFLNLSSNNINKKTTYIILAGISILIGVLLFFTIRILKKRNIVFKHRLFTINKDSGFFLINNNKVCSIEQVSRIQIYTEIDESSIYNLFLILKGGSKVEVHSSSRFGLICDIADEIADFIDLSVYC